MRTIDEWQKIVTEWAISKGFNWTQQDIDTLLLRLHSEISEASEAARDNDFKGLAEELADIFIRLVNIAEVMGVDLEIEVSKKQQKNTNRSKLHGRARKWIHQPKMFDVQLS